MADNFSAGFYFFLECRISVCGGSYGPRIFNRTVIPAGARADVGGTDFRFLPKPFRGTPFFSGKRARRAGIQTFASFRKRARRDARPSSFWKAGVRFPPHRGSCPVKMPQLAVRTFSPPSSAGPPELERKPGFRLSTRAFMCDSAGFQRTLAHARNSRPTRETRAPAGMTGHGNTRVKKNERSSTTIRIRFRHGIPAPSFTLPRPAPPTSSPDDLTMAWFQQRQTHSVIKGGACGEPEFKLWPRLPGNKYGRNQNQPHPTVQAPKSRNKFRR